MTDEIEVAKGVSVQPGGIVEPTIRISVGVIREATPRRRCASCGVRRVLYRIGVATWAGSDASAARCSQCWGIAP